MKKEKIETIMRQLFRCGNIVTVTWDEMRVIRKEFGIFVEPVEIEIVRSDFDTVSFREAR